MSQSLSPSRWVPCALSAAFAFLPTHANATGPIYLPPDYVPPDAVIACVDSGLEIDSIEIDVAQGGHLDRSPIHYIASSEYEVTIVHALCSRVTDIYQNERLLSDFVDPIEGGSPLYVVVSRGQIVVDGETHAKTTLRFPITHQGRGRSFEMSAVVKSTNTNEEVSAEWVASDVKEVNGLMEEVRTIEEMENDFLVGLYEQFGDFDQMRDADGERIAYDLSLAPLASFGGFVFGSGMTMDDDGSILFGMQFKGVAPVSICDPDVYVHGRFTFVGNGDSVYLEWVDEPSARIDLPFGCGLLSGLSDLYQSIATLSLVNAVSDQEDVIASEIEGGFASLAVISTCPFCRVEEVTIGDGIMQVSITPPLARVSINVPYGTYATNGSPRNYGLALQSEALAFIAPGGFAESCATAQDDGSDCHAYPVTGAGRFNWYENPPVQSPWFETEGGAVGFYAIRKAVRDRLVGLSRTPSELPFEDENVGALVAKRGTAQNYGRLMFAGRPCSAQARGIATEVDYLSLSVNDFNHTNLRPLGRGEFETTILLPTVGQAGLLGDSPACRSLPGTPLVEMEMATTTGGVVFGG